MHGPIELGAVHPMSRAGTLMLDPTNVNIVPDFPSVEMNGAGVSPVQLGYNGPSHDTLPTIGEADGGSVTWDINAEYLSNSLVVRSSAYAVPTD